MNKNYGLGRVESLRFGESDRYEIVHRRNIPFTATFAAHDNGEVKHAEQALQGQLQAAYQWAYVSHTFIVVNESDGERRIQGTVVVESIEKTVMDEPEDYDDITWHSS